MVRDRLAKIGWIAVAVWVLVYAPMAFEYMSRFFFSGPALWDHAYSAAVGNSQALGPGSIHAVQSARYNENAAVLVAHTTLAAAAIALAVFQLSSRSRKRIAVHRRLGRILVPTVIVAMIAAMTFLAIVGPSGTFDGPAFTLQLWGLAIGTTAGAVLGWLAIRRRQIGAHQIMMSYMFALLCTAPFLRLGYLLFGLAWPHETQEISNLAGAAVLAYLAPSSAFVVAAFVPSPRSARHPARWLTPPIEFAAATSGAIGAATLFWQYRYHFNGFDRVTLTWFTVGALVTGAAIVKRITVRDDRGRNDSALYLASVALGFPLTALLWAAYTTVFTTTAAFYGALLTGPAVAISLGVLAIAASRHHHSSGSHLASAAPIEAIA